MARNKRLNKWIAGGAGVLAAATMANRLQAQTSDPLLDALIKKGILTEKEAQDIKAEAQTNMMSSMPASKWKIADSIKSIGLYGDVRFRYEYRGVDNPKDPVLNRGNTYYLERFRYALRAGIRGELFDDWNYGIRLETSTNPRSPWATFGKNTTSGSVTPADKAQSGINIGQVFLSWHPADWYEMTVGRMPMPLYTTPMVWDSDINPEGAFEKFKYSLGMMDLFADFGQFMYQFTNPDTGVPSSDTFLLAWQLGANVKLPRDMSFKIAPVVYNYVGNGSGNGLNEAFSGQGLATPDANGLTNPNNAPGVNQNGINDLLVVEVPAEFNFKIVNPTLGTYHARVFGDFAYNINGSARAQAAKLASDSDVNAAHLSRAYTDQNKAYQIGFGIGNEGPVYGPTQGLVYGSTSKKNTWEARVYWQHIEQYALDVNLIDSDFFEGRGNLQGIYAAFSYSFTDAIIGTARYGYASRINNNIGTGGNNLDIPVINPINNYNLVQLDLTWRF